MTLWELGTISIGYHGVSNTVCVSYIVTSYNIIIDEYSSKKGRVLHL